MGWMTLSRQRGKTSINSSSPFALCIKSWLLPFLMLPSSAQSPILKLTSLAFLDLGSWLSAWREISLRRKHKSVTRFYAEISLLFIKYFCLWSFSFYYHSAVLPWVRAGGLVHLCLIFSPLFLISSIFNVFVLVFVFVFVKVVTYANEH